jgi:hypothetical protein
MTEEEEWLQTTNPRSMAGFVRGKGSDRRRRWLACACAEACLRDFNDNDALMAALRVAQRTADGPSENPDRLEVLERFRASEYFDWRDEYLPILACGTREDVERAPVVMFEQYAFNIYINPRAIVPSLFRCVFGNPFRPVAFDPRWRTSDVVGLARAIYDDKAFDRMPILADALMDAGCEEEQIIAHCRGDGPHVRGCWVVDLILEKN